jgi:hypothetical protein
MLQLVGCDLAEGNIFGGKEGESRKAMKYLVGIQFAQYSCFLCLLDT